MGFHIRLRVNKIREYRLEKGLTQADLGKLAGMSSTTISGMERGLYNKDIEKLKQVAAVFNTTHHDLLDV